MNVSRCVEYGTLHYVYDTALLSRNTVSHCGCPLLSFQKLLTFSLNSIEKFGIFSGRKAVSNNFRNVMRITLVPPNYIALLFLTFVDIFDYFDLLTIHFPVLETVQILVRSTFNNRYVILGIEMEIENR